MYVCVSVELKCSTKSICANCSEHDITIYMYRENQNLLGQWCVNNEF